MADRREELVRKMIAEGTSDDDIRATLKVFDAQQQTPAPTGGALQTLKHVGIGALKGAGGTIAHVLEMAGNSGMLPGVQPSAFDANMRHPAFRKAEQVTTASNDAQRTGKFIEGAAELALPTGAAVNAIPRAGRAATKFARVANVANKVPVNVEGPGQVALRIQQLADRGGTAPRMVSKFLQRTTDPNQAAMTFDEGRDFYSNISRLSADEYGRLTGPIKREVGNLKAALDGSLREAAGSVGKGAEYGSAMKEYARAAKLRQLKESLVDGLKRAALPAGGVGTAYYLLKDKLGGVMNE